MKIDFHTHTHHSYDCDMKPLKVLQLAKQRGLDAIVINDHDTIAGGLECQQINPYKDLKVIVGAEIKTTIGDVTGIFLTKEIISRNYLDVVKEIKAQGGISILNHPYVGHKLDNVDFSVFDLIEGYNGRLSPELNEKAIELAKKHNKQIISGSDSHTYSEIGNCFTVIENDDFLNPTATHYKKCKVSAPIRSQLIKARKKKDAILFLKILLGAPRKVMGLK